MAYTHYSPWHSATHQDNAANQAPSDRSVLAATRSRTKMQAPEQDPSRNRLSITQHSSIEDQSTTTGAFESFIIQAGGQYLVEDSTDDRASQHIKTPAASNESNAIQAAPTLVRDSHQVRFAYNQDRSRYWRQDTDAYGVVTTTVYLGGVERISRSNSDIIEWKRYNGASMITVKTDTAGDIQHTDERVIYKDHLGSTDVITDGLAKIVQTMSFDAWGQRRNADTWQAFETGVLATFDHSETTQGYTGHEQLDEVGLIHMNGRIYDPRLARFMQADPLIQAATNTQSLNRYSYVWNNPLNKIDPSGYAVFTLAVGAFLMAAGASVHLAVVFTMMAFAGMLDALHAGATFQDAFRSGIISGLSAVAFTYIGRHFAAKGAQNAANSSQTAAAGADWGGSMYTNFGGNTLTGTQVAQQISAHAAVGGITAVAQGGKFGHGFLSAGITKGITGAVHGGPVAVRLSASMAIGGTVSKISGGKFANGAKTAAFQFMFNEAMSQKLRYPKRAKNWRQAEKIEATRQQKLKGERVIRGRVGASYDGDKYIGYRIYDVVSVDESGQWTLTEVKFRRGRTNGWWPFKSYQGATIYGQSEFDFQASNGLTLKGKGIPGGKVTLSPEQYNIQWVMMDDRGGGMLYPVNIGNEDDMYMNVMRAYPYDEKWWD